MSAPHLSWESLSTPPLHTRHVGLFPQLCRRHDAPGGPVPSSQRPPEVFPWRAVKSRGGGRPLTSDQLSVPLWVESAHPRGPGESVSQEAPGVESSIFTNKRGKPGSAYE